MNLITRLKSFFSRHTEFPPEAQRPLTVTIVTSNRIDTHIHCPYCRQFISAEMYSEHLDTCEPLFWSAYEEKPAPVQSVQSQERPRFLQRELVYIAQHHERHENVPSKRYDQHPRVLNISRRPPRYAHFPPEQWPNVDNKEYYYPRQKVEAQVNHLRHRGLRLIFRGVVVIHRVFPHKQIFRPPGDRLKCRLFHWIGLHIPQSSLANPNLHHAFPPAIHHSAKPPIFAAN